jgi:hypothetical protein
MTTNASTATKNVTVKFFANDKGNPPERLADVEIHFVDGVFAGLELIGFALWERKNGGRNVTFPARQYSVNGERRSFALLRPIVDALRTGPGPHPRAYNEHEAELAASA